MYIALIACAILLICNLFHVIAHFKKEVGLIYILIWTPPHFEPFNFIEMGQTSFMNCTFQNCFLTADHGYFSNILDFEVILFNVVNLEEGMSLPTKRSKTQKYFMYGVEPAAYHPVSESFNKFFNYTFTYKLSSNVTIPSVVIKDQYDKVIGPKIDMHWMKLSEMNETSDYVKEKLQNKSIAAAWIVSHCETPWRNAFAKRLKKFLKKYGHRLDVYGKCGTIPCPKGEMEDLCFAAIESDYYFYLSSENSFGEDYVTEKVLNALEHFTVPVVFGTANYSRFMPKGIYLDARELDAEQMAKKMDNIIKNKNKYYEFFKWHGYYSFHFSGENHFSDEMCRLCAFLNDKALMNQTSVYENISDWWNEEWPTWPTPKYKPVTLEPFMNLIPEDEESGVINIVSKLRDFVFGILR